MSTKAPAAERQNTSPSPIGRAAEIARKAHDSVTGGLRAVSRNKGKLSVVGMSALALSGGLAGKAESAGESSQSTLAGDNQIVLVNVIPSDRADLTSLDPTIRDHAQMLTNLTENRGWAGWEPRFSQDSSGSVEVKDLVLPLTEAQIAAEGNDIQAFDSQVYGSLQKQPWYNSLNYYLSYFGGKDWPGGDACSIYSSSPQGIKSIPGVPDMSIIRLNQQGCDIGFNVVSGFTYNEVVAARSMLQGFGYKYDSNQGDILQSDVRNVWGIVDFDQGGNFGYGASLIDNPYFTWPVTNGVIGSGKIIENAKKNALANYPGGAPDPGNRFPGGETIDFTAQAAPGWHFVGWDGDVSGKNPTAEITGLDSAKNVEAIFAKNPAQKEKLTVNLKGHGTIKGGNVALNVKTGKGSRHIYTEDKGQKLTLTETPGKGEKFAGWSGACHGLMKKCVVVVNADKSVTAKFVPTKK